MVECFMNSERRIPNSAFKSGLRRRAAEVEGKIYLFLVFDNALCRFKALDIIHQGAHEPLGMLRRHYNTALDLRLGHVRHHVHEVYYKLGEGMSNYREVGILTISHLFGKLYVELLFGCLLGFHNIE